MALVQGDGERSRAAHVHELGRDLLGSALRTPASPRYALLLEVHAATGLCASDTYLWGAGGEGSDPYVRLLLGGREVRRTAYVSCTLAPRFDVSFRIPLARDETDVRCRRRRCRRRLTLSLPIARIASSAGGVTRQS